MAKHRLWTNDELLQIKRLHDEGLNYVEIGEMFCASRQLIARVMKNRINADGSVKVNRRQVRATDRLQAARLREKGLGWAEIADMLNVSPVQLEAFCKLHGGDDPRGKRSDILLCGECHQWAYTGRMIWPHGMIGICERDGATCQRCNRCRYGDD